MAKMLSDRAAKEADRAQKFADAAREGRLPTRYAGTVDGRPQLEQLGQGIREAKGLLSNAAMPVGGAIANKGGWLDSKPRDTTKTRQASTRILTAEFALLYSRVLGGSTSSNFVKQYLLVNIDAKGNVTNLSDLGNLTSSWIWTSGTNTAQSNTHWEWLFLCHKEKRPLVWKIDVESYYSGPSQGVGLISDQSGMVTILTLEREVIISSDFNNDNLLNDIYPAEAVLWLRERDRTLLIVSSTSPPELMFFNLVDSAARASELHSQLSFFPTPGVFWPNISGQNTGVIGDIGLRDYFSLHNSNFVSNNSPYLFSLSYHPNIEYYGVNRKQNNAQSIAEFSKNERMFISSEETLFFFNGLGESMEIPLSKVDTALESFAVSDWYLSDAMYLGNSPNLRSMLPGNPALPTPTLGTDGETHLIQRIGSHVI